MPTIILTTVKATKMKKRIMMKEESIDFSDLCRFRALTDLTLEVINLSIHKLEMKPPILGKVNDLCSPILQ